MRALARVLALALLLPPLVAASAAHPHEHTYVGAGAAYALAASVPACEDTSVEPDGDPETGVGGACFPFQTVYGDDTGATVTAWVAEDVAAGDVAFAACVDVNGDGVCSDLTGDPFHLCHTGPTGTGSLSLTSVGACTVYEDPAALQPYAYVILLPGGSAGTAQPVRGRAWLT